MNYTASFISYKRREPEMSTYAAGSVLLAEDTSGKGHASRVVSSTDSLAVMVQL